MLFTLIIGNCFKIGKMIGSLTFGVFIYTIIQIILLLIIFSLMIKYMSKLNVPSYILILSILFIGLNPVIATNSVASLKDVQYAIFNLVYVIILLQIVMDKNILNNSKKIIILIISMLLIMMFRNNGIYTIVLSFPSLFFLYKNKIKKLIIIFLIPLSIFTIYNDIILPYYKISNGSIREVLNIPFMQIARTVHYHKDDFTIKDKEIINRVLDFDRIGAMYEANLSDYVKNTYKKDATKYDLIEFFKVWIKYLIKHPLTYIESFISSYYGYFYPINADNLLIYDYNFVYIEDMNNYINIRKSKKNNDIKNTMNIILTTYYNSPFSLSNSAYYNWYLILTIISLLKKKRYKYIVPLLPLFITLLVCLASPVNGSIRYTLPIVFSLPIIISINYITRIQDK